MLLTTNKKQREENKGWIQEKRKINETNRILQEARKQTSKKTGRCFDTNYQHQERSCLSYYTIAELKHQGEAKQLIKQGVIGFKVPEGQSFRWQRDGVAAGIAAKDSHLSSQRAHYL